MNTLEERVASIKERLLKAQKIKSNEDALNKARASAKVHMADESHLKRRARKLAKDILRKQILKDTPYKSLSLSDKVKIDTMIESQKKVLDSLVKKLLPAIKKKEVDRLAKELSEDIYTADKKPQIVKTANGKTIIRNSPSLIHMNYKNKKKPPSINNVLVKPKQQPMDIV